MDLKVRFRFNKATGEVELFDIEDEGGQRLPDAEHNRIHDRAAADLGNVIERDPRVSVLLPGASAPAPQAETEPETGETSADSRLARDAQRREQ
jgi:hypothetical protein